MMEGARLSLALEPFEHRLQPALQERFEKAKNWDAGRAIHDEVGPGRVAFDPVPDGSLTQMAEVEFVPVLEDRPGEVAARTRWVVVLADVACLALRSRLAYLETPISPQEDVCGHLAARKGCGWLVRGLQHFDCDVTGGQRDACQAGDLHEVVAELFGCSIHCCSSTEDWGVAGELSCRIMRSLRLTIMFT